METLSLGLGCDTERKVCTIRDGLALRETARHWVGSDAQEAQKDPYVNPFVRETRRQPNRQIARGEPSAPAMAQIQCRVVLGNLAADLANICLTAATTLPNQGFPTRFLDIQRATRPEFYLGEANMARLGHIGNSIL